MSLHGVVWGHSPETVLMIDGPPYPLGGVARVACVPLRVNLQVNVAQLVHGHGWEGQTNMVEL